MERNRKLKILYLCWVYVEAKFSGKVVGRKCQGGVGGERCHLAEYLMGRFIYTSLGGFKHSNSQHRRLECLASQPQHALL